MSKFFPNVKKNFGFGCMRLPMNGDEVDYAEFTKMVDYFIENGFNYFDTACCYIGGKSETALRDCLTSRYDRDKYILTDKLTSNYFSKNEDIRPLFESQLKACGVDYFDFYLMHSQTKDIYEHYKKCNAYETALEFLAEGRIKHIGISFHDKPEVLEQILTDYPQIEVVQIQFNYLDYEDPNVQSRKVYEVCRKHNKPVIVMCPVKGGSLFNLPLTAKRAFAELPNSPASYAIRFAAGFEGMFMVLSGMSSLEMIKENVGFMTDFVPLNDKENETLVKVRNIINSQEIIPCTGCNYCIDGCPMSIPISDLFACMNDRKEYSEIGAEKGKASDCIRCGQCEGICPQHLEICNLLEKVAEKLEK